MEPERVLLPDEIASEDGVVAYVGRGAFPDAEAAIAEAAREDTLSREATGMRAEAILMREESEVEARINGHEFPLWVECTTRAKAHAAYWKVLDTRCGRVMVGSGTDTYDPTCDLIAGHSGACKSRDAIDQHRLRESR